MIYFLREISKKDIPFINAWRNDRGVIDSLGSPFRFIATEVDEAWFSSYLSNRSNNVRLVIEDGEANRPIGAVYLVNIDWIARSGEFAIWVGDTASQGRGAGSFATRAMLHHAFNDLGLNRVHLTVLLDNVRAINLYKKNGFLEEGRLRQAIYKNGEFLDLVQMSILSKDYRGQAKAVIEKFV